MPLQYRLLGTLDVSQDGRAIELGGPKQRAVLAVLLLSANRPVSVIKMLPGCGSQWKLPSTTICWR